MIQIKRLSSTDAGFNETLAKLLAFENAQDAKVDATVADILADIKKRGDEALLEYTRRFDRLERSFGSGSLNCHRAACSKLCKACLRISATPWSKPRSECAPTMKNRWRNPGAMSNPTAHCLARKSPRWIVSACMFPAARRPILRQC